MTAGLAVKDRKRIQITSDAGNKTFSFLRFEIIKKFGTDTKLLLLLSRSQTKEVKYLNNIHQVEYCSMFHVQTRTSTETLEEHAMAEKKD